MPNISPVSVALSIPVAQLGICEVPQLAHCSSSSCEIAFAKAAARGELFRPNIGRYLLDEVRVATAAHLYFPVQVFLALRLGETLDRVAQHGARHIAIMFN